MSRERALVDKCGARALRDTAFCGKTGVSLRFFHICCGLLYPQKFSTGCGKPVLFRYTNCIRNPEYILIVILTRSQNLKYIHTLHRVINRDVYIVKLQPLCTPDKFLEENSNKFDRMLAVCLRMGRIPCIARAWRPVIR